MGVLGWSLPASITLYLGLETGHIAVMCVLFLRCCKVFSFELPKPGRMKLSYSKMGIPRIAFAVERIFFTATFAATPSL